MNQQLWIAVGLTTTIAARKTNVRSLARILDHILNQCRFKVASWRLTTPVC